MTGRDAGSTGTGTEPRRAATSPADRDDAAATSGERPRLVDGWSLALVVLAGAQPFATYLDRNIDRLVWPASVVWTGVVWTALLVLTFVGVRLLTRRVSPVPVAAVVAVVNLSFWNFARVFSYEPASDGARWTALAIWAAGTGLFAALCFLLFRHRVVRLFAVLFLAVWTAALLLDAQVVRSNLEGGDQVQMPAASPVQFQERPNVYWFVLDEHARSDQLLARAESDNSWFGTDLDERGFSTSESSTGSYVHTHSSMSSTLAMDHVWTAGPEYKREFEVVAPIIAGDNPVVATFEANGYRYIGAPDGKVEWSICPEAGPGRSCIEPEGGRFALREPYSYLALSTPVGSLGLPVTHNDPDSIRAGIAEARSDPQPFFLFAHLLSPHFPFRYEEGCAERRPWVDGYNYSPAQFRRAYANDVQCLDRAMIGLIDDILANDPDAVIIIQSDHGSRLDFAGGQRPDVITDDQLQERYAVVNAMRLPSSCRGRPIEGEQLVNTFRIVFGCLSGDEPDLLDPRYFFPIPGTNRSFVELNRERAEAP